MTRKEYLLTPKHLRLAPEPGSYRFPSDLNLFACCLVMQLFFFVVGILVKLKVI